MAYLEAEAYRDGSSEDDFMEEAGSGVALVVHEFAERYGLSRHVALLCGKGNNAGDAYVSGIHLLHLEYTVHAFQVPPIGECSDLCQKNAERFLGEGGHITEVKSESDLNFPENGVIIDGLFGTGFRGDVKDPFAYVIRAANKSGLIIIAIDIPSGLDGETGHASEEAIVATETAFLGLPKTGFFLEDGWDHVGYLRYVDYGLPSQYIEEIEEDLVLLTPDMLMGMMPRIKRSRHKYEAGSVTGIAGSKGYPGAPVLSSLATLRSGAGIVKLHYPANMDTFGAYPLELIKIPFQYQDPDSVLKAANQSSSCFIGPGMGLEGPTREFLKYLIPRIEVPVVIDADALRIVAEENIELPPQTVLTPHKGELARLLKMEASGKTTAAFLRICQSYAEEKRVTLVMKGGPTFIFHPLKPIYVNATGDPGMATAGTGDVLTGIIAALLAQKATPHHAASLGVYLHGLAGEHAAQEKTPYCMIASDLFDFLPAAFAFEFS